VKAWIVALIVAAAVAPAAAQKPKYRVKATFDKHVEFSALRTYAWMPGWAAFLWPVDQQVTAAVDRELAQLGFVQVDSEPDVIVTYAAVQRTDVDLKSKLPDDPTLHREYRVGTLVVLLRDPETLRDLFRARGDAPLAHDEIGIARQIDRMVGEMFDRYPTRHNSR
jgi:hypothetical protein